MRIIDRVNEYIVDPHFVSKRNRVAHYPSEASVISRTDGNVIGKCHRATWYNWKGEKSTNPTDARGMWTMNFGKELERMYVEYIKQLGIWAGNNVKYFDPLHNISGEADLFIFGEENTPYIGVEIKSAYGYGFQNQVKKFPKIENLLQVALYLDHFQLSEWRLVYHSRDTMENVEYGITMGTDEENGQVKGRFLLVDDIPVRVFYIDDIYDRYKQLGEYVIKNDIPPRDYTYGYSLEQSIARCNNGNISKSKLSQIKTQKKTDSDWQCLYCSYLDKCWEERRKEILGA